MAIIGSSEPVTASAPPVTRAPPGFHISETRVAYEMGCHLLRRSVFQHRVDKRVVGSELLTCGFQKACDHEFLQIRIDGCRRKQPELECWDLRVVVAGQSFGVCLRYFLDILDDRPGDLGECRSHEVSIHTSSKGAGCLVGGATDCPPGVLGLDGGGRSANTLAHLGFPELKRGPDIGILQTAQRHPARVSADEPRLVERIIALATEYGRYGYRRMTGLLRGEGWRVNHQRVERLWRREGLKVPQKQPNRGRLWLTDGLCVRCRPAYRLHVWAYDFLTARTHDGRPLKILVVVDEYSRECLAIRVARRLRSTEVLKTLAELFVTYGLPAHIRTLTEAKILIERWRREYNTVRPHSALGYRPPAPAAISPASLNGLIMSPALS